MLDKNNLPKHVAIIMDGNGRWAQEKGLARTSGHRRGVERVKEIVKAAAKSGIQTLTFFAFSSENWSRPKREIGILMRYLNNFLDRQIEELDKNNIRFLAIGRDEPLPVNIRQKISDAQKKTKDNSGMTVVLALNYGARQEIVDAAKKFACEVLENKLDINGLNEENFSAYLYTAGLPDPDLLIRTSGEIRLSNFLLWQLSYAELYFPKIYWPDFGAKEFNKAIKAYQKRARRFGKVVA